MTWGYITEEDTGTIHLLSNHLKIAGMQWNLPVLGIHTGPFFPSFYLYTPANSYLASQVALGVKNLPADAGDIRDTGSVPGLGRSPGGGHNNPLQYYFLENPIDSGAWWATVHRVSKSLTQLSIFWRDLACTRKLLPPWLIKAIFFPQLSISMTGTPTLFAKISFYQTSSCLINLSLQNPLIVALLVISSEIGNI